MDKTAKISAKQFEAIIDELLSSLPESFAELDLDKSPKNDRDRLRKKAKHGVYRLEELMVYLVPIAQPS